MGKNLFPAIYFLKAFCFYHYHRDLFPLADRQVFQKKFVTLLMKHKREGSFAYDKKQTTKRIKREPAIITRSFR